MSKKVADHPSAGEVRGRPHPSHQWSRVAGLAMALMTLGMAVLVLTPGGVFAGAVRFAAVVAVGVGTAFLLPRMRPILAAVTLTVLGGAAAVAGAAVLLPRLLRAGPVTETAGAATVLLGGLLGIGCAVTLFVRSVSGWLRLWAVPVVLVVGYGVFLPLGIAVYATHPPRTPVGSATPAEHQLAYRDVSFPSADGVALSGWYVPAVNRAAVIVLPGSGSTRSSVLDHGAVLAGHGFGVLMFDPRGQGNSGGQAMELGWYGEQDITAAVTYLQQQPDIEPGWIGAVGLSMGGEEAVGALSADPRLRAVVAEGATNRVLADKAWLADTYGARGSIQYAVEAVTYGLADVLTDAEPPISLGDAVVASAPRRVLLIAGGEVPDEVVADTAVQARSPDTVALWVVPGAGHIGGLAAAPGEWESRVTTFLASALS